MRRPIQANAGFTVIELTLVAALAAVVAFLAYTPIVNGLILTQRESTLMGMFSAGDAVATRLATLLQPAVIPVAAAGTRYGEVGDKWRAALAAGTDVLPFCTPVLGRDPASKLSPVNSPDAPEKSINSMVDDAGVPYLGIVLPGGAMDGEWVPSVDASGKGVDTNKDGTYDPNTDGRYTFRSVLDMVRYPKDAADWETGGRNGDLARLEPGFFGFPNPTPATIKETHTRFAARLVFPEKSQRGFAVIRFVPDTLRTGSPEVLEEKDLLGPGAGFDLDGDGEATDSFLRGRLVLEYANNNSSYEESRNVQVEFPLGRQSILLQLNTDDDETYAPIFQLVEDENGNAVRHLLRVRLLLFDELMQRRTAMATGRRDGRQFLTRRVETVIELRNMSF